MRSVFGFEVSKEIKMRRMDKRPTKLIGHQLNMPEMPLPEGVGAFEYAPFGEVLPRALAIVHQGGVGTTGQSLRSGKPQLILPHAHDQFDNAARVARAGCGRVLPRPRYNAETAIQELKALLDQAEYFEKAVQTGYQVQSEKGAAAAADALEEVMATTT
jgi:rhamnosyltransferase subunit B